MEVIILVGVLAALAGGVAGVFFCSGKSKREIESIKGELDVMTGERDSVKSELESTRQELEKVREEYSGARIQQANAAAQLEAEQKLRMQEKEYAAKMLESERETAHKLMQQHKEQYAQALEGMKNQIKSMSEEILGKRSEELKKSNVEQLSHILAPMKEQMQKMEVTVQKVNADSAAHKAAIAQSIETLAKETIKVGEQADGLAKALKSKGKVQGDWGEQVLENILENSGLRKDQEYFIQHNIKGEDNSNIRPDVLIKCPGNKYIVVDSKVSLTAYIDYVNAQTPDQQQAYAKANRDSVKAHIDELASVNYAKYVDNTIEHVLMFVPNEGSYILALQTDPQIGQYAFKKGVLLINPTNLMMSLQLIYNIWQSERQAKNVETIVSESEALYEKFVTFIGTFSKLKKDIESVSKTFDTAENQLTQGRGNIVRRLENLKTLGVTPKKQIDADYVEKSDI